MFARAVASMAMLLMASEASATIVVPMTIEEMAIEASCVARARVVNTQATWDDSHRRIYTYTEIQILERMHTKGEVLDSVIIRTLGGEVGNIGMKVSGTPRFTLGEEVVVFLRTDPADRAQFQVVGMSQGKFHVERPEKGGAVAVPSVEGLAFAKPGSDGKMKIDPMNVDAARIPLDIMRERVRAAVQPPVPANPQLDVTTPPADQNNIAQ
jgi:hypothetical protein